MEFVDGEDLSERIKRGPIPLDEALVSRAADLQMRWKRLTSRASSIAI